MQPDEHHEPTRRGPEDGGAASDGRRGAAAGRKPRPVRDALASAFRQEALDAHAEQAPRGGRRIIWLALACVCCLLAWASLAKVDEVARGEGKVIPSQSVQIVQSLDGGAIAEILTREGASVARDEPLLRIETIRPDAQRGESVARIVALRARAERLRAEARGHDKVGWDADIARHAPEIVQRESALFAVRRGEHLAALNAVDRQIVQRSQEMREAVARRDAAGGSLALLVREVDVTRPLVRTGAVSEIEVIRLERDLVRTRGESEMAGAQIGRLRAAIEEARQRRLEAEDGFRARARVELNDVTGELSRLQEGLKALEDRVTKTVLRAPAAGIVKTLHVKSVGSVAQPGKDLVEIVPADGTLLVEARIHPRDIAHLHPGQVATVRLSAYDYAVHGGLTGTLEHISADTIADERGNAFYIVRVRTRRPEGDGSAIGSASRPILPGMTATVDVLTGKRTVLVYLLKPLIRAKDRAFTER